MKTLYQGAEAVLTQDGELVIKHRISKGYRVKELDQRLRKQRTQQESKLLIEARRLGLDVPRVLNSNDYEIQMEFLKGDRVKDILDSLPVNEQEKLSEGIGEAIAKLHEAGIMHGDLTTSNMIYKEERLYLIDFGLAKHSSRVEDQAVDLFLLYEALKAGHFAVLEGIWNRALKTYNRKYSNASAVLQQVEKIKSRRRYSSEI